VLILPTVLVGLVEHNLSTPLVLLQALCFAYMYAQGGVAHRSYWKSVHSAEQLRCHAESAQLAAVAADATSFRLRSEIAHSAKMELELRQAQKLEAIGRLAAGIAHEINTPLQYIGDSCRFMREGIEQFTAAFDEHQRIITELAAGKLAVAEALGATAQLVEQRDLAYLRDNLSEALALALDGLGRVGKIVTATTQFAAPNVRQKTLASVNTAIESMLLIANNQTHTVADVKTELGELPSILCHPGELGQVFLHLLINAAHAIREVVQDTGARGIIRIKTWAEPGWIRISIHDTGTGICTEHLEKIYEPFFTTKPVGMGTGQGLAIARSVIVGKHHGTIDVRSQVGAGSTFTIGLPIAR
jgi:two-component system NtrC family sensor kinase